MAVVGFKQKTIVPIKSIPIVSHKRNSFNFPRVTPKGATKFHSIVQLTVKASKYANLPSDPTLLTN